MKSDAYKFWERVETLLRKSGYSRRDVCHKSDGLIKYYTWSNKKSQGILPNLELAAAFAKIFHTTIDYLYFGDDAMRDIDPMLIKLSEDDDVKRILKKMSFIDKSKLRILETVLSTWIDEMAFSAKFYANENDSISNFIRKRSTLGEYYTKDSDAN